MTACAVAFAHGSNDVANAIGPLAAVVHVAEGADLAGKAAVAPWMLMVGGIGIVVGLATWGYRVMETVGRKITELTPSRGFAAELAAALTIVLASRLGIPVSTTHILVGSVLGVGLARGIGALDLRVVGSILVSWVATLPIAAVLSIFFFYFFKGLLRPRRCAHVADGESLRRSPIRPMQEHMGVAVGCARGSPAAVRRDGRGRPRGRRAGRREEIDGLEHEADASRTRSAATFPGGC